VTVTESTGRVVKSALTRMGTLRNEKNAFRRSTKATSSSKRPLWKTLLTLADGVNPCTSTTLRSRLKLKLFVAVDAYAGPPSAAASSSILPR
jgi:hypothetical protein